MKTAALLLALAPALAAACSSDHMYRNVRDHDFAVVKGGEAVKKLDLAPKVLYGLSVVQQTPRPRRAVGPAATANVVRTLSPNVTEADLVIFKPHIVIKAMRELKSHSIFKTPHGNYSIVGYFNFDEDCSIETADTTLYPPGSH